MSLNDLKVRNAKSKEKFYKLTDGDGLYLHVTEKKSKLWRFRYRFNHKEKLLALGSYPEVSLYDARTRRDEARKQIANGIDPSAVRKAMKQAETEETENFEVIAREWHTKFTPTWTVGHAEKLLSALDRDIFPWIGVRPIRELKAIELLATLRRIESRGVLETAHRMRGLIGQVFRYAVATGRAERDPTSDLRGALPQPKERHYPAIVDPKEVAPLLREIEGYRGDFITKCALRLAPMLFVRPGELRQAEWAEIDLDEAVWNIPAEKMKMKQNHIVPLSSQAIEILTDLKPLTGTSMYVFPSLRTSKRPMSNNTVNAALRRMGYDKNTMTGHGFRALARTILDETLQINPNVIEAQLAHKVPDRLGTAYNRTSHIVERRKMMQTWANYLDELKVGAKVIPFQKVK